MRAHCLHGWNHMKPHERWVLFLLLAVTVAPWIIFVLACRLSSEYPTTQIFIKPTWLFGTILQLELYLAAACSIPQFNYLTCKGTTTHRQIWLQCFFFLCGLSLLFPAARLGNIPSLKALLLQTNMALFSLLVLLCYSMIQRRSKSLSHIAHGALLAWCVLPAALAYTTAEFAGKPLGEYLQWTPFAFNHTLLQGGAGATALLQRSLLTLLVCVLVAAIAVAATQRKSTGAGEASHA